MAKRTRRRDSRSGARRELREFASRHLKGVYSVAGQITPGAVNDQIDRGDRVSELLIRAGRIGSGRPLLVVGGGVAGLAVALHAVGRSVPVTVLERREAEVSDDKVSALFGVQAHCRTRRLEPTGYLWPANGYWRNRYPTDGSRHALAYHADWSNNVANRWRQSFAGNLESLRLAGIPERLTVLPGVGDLPDDFACRARGWLYADVPRAGRIGPFGAIVMAIGAGSERDAIKRFRSLRFWDSDTFDQVGLGCQAERADIVISGGGDGAIQDTIRCLIDPRFRSVEDLLGNLRVPERVAREIPRSRSSAGESCSNFRRLDRQCRHAADLYVSECGAHSVAQLLRDDRPLVHFLFRCDHVQNAYPLNRFVLHLLHRISETEYTHAPFLKFHSFQELTNVGCWLHTPISARRCQGQRHNIQTHVYRKCNEWAGVPIGHRWPPKFRLVLLRHGADPDTLHPLALRAANGR